MTKPKVDPARWLAARQQWENSPEVSFTDIAAQLGIAIPTVSIRAKKECWVRAEVVDLERINYSPRQLTEIAMRALVRAAMQTKDTASAVKAAGMLLERTMGRVVATQDAPMLPADFDNEANQWPEWLQARRHAYQEPGFRLDEPQEHPAELVPGVQEPFSAPDPALPPAEPPKGRPLRLVEQPPSFYDRPDRPAQGNYREVDRLD